MILYKKYIPSSVSHLCFINNAFSMRGCENEEGKTERIKVFLKRYFDLQSKGYSNQGQEYLSLITTFHMSHIYIAYYQVKYAKNCNFHIIYFSVLIKFCCHLIILYIKMLWIIPITFPKIPSISYSIYVNWINKLCV